jgi:molybdopterin molybdotransferase
MAGGLIELDEARRLVLATARPLSAEEVPLADALERVLAEDVVATDAVPAFDNSAMDGFALRARDLHRANRTSPASLTVVGESRAGHPGAASVGPGQAITVSTGAMMPSGADAVVPLEEADADHGVLAVFGQTRPGTFVRRAGDDISLGQTVLTRGTRLGPAELGVLATLGREAALCTRRPRLSVLTTGDELVASGAALHAGAVRDSSAYSIPALARQAGGEVVHVARVADAPRATEAAIADTLAHDVVIVCGGASVGEHDYVKRALAALEVREHFWGIALKPGKPTWFGVSGETLVFGLPGNPVSSIVTFILLARQALLALMGASPAPLRTTARLACDYEKPPGRAHAVRCRLSLSERGFEVTPTGPQGSHVLTSMLGAQALAIIPSASGPVSAGALVQIELLAPLAGGMP